jgi:pyridoxamine 5'-phosphate oxidase
VASEDEIREQLRSLPVFAGERPEFDPGGAPDHPAELFLDWLGDAIDRGASEPHAFVLSTAGADGRPNARVVILKGLDDGRWPFATSSSSAKGSELEANPHAAATFYWRETGRQVRLRGLVAPAGAEASARDFLARSPASRAEAMHGRQSQVLEDETELDAALRDGRERVEADPQAVAETWTLFHLIPDEVEFWQADEERHHVRLRYTAAGGAWTRTRLWP